MHSDSEFNKFLYCCVNLVMIAIGAALSAQESSLFSVVLVLRPIWAIFHTPFSRTACCSPVALTAIGLAVIGAGVYWQAAIEAAMVSGCAPCFRLAFAISLRIASTEFHDGRTTCWLTTR